MKERARIFEMSPRDGLQNEKRLISTADKVQLVDLLTASGLSHIEVTSFVSPKWVPQMADAAEVLAAIRRRPGTRYTALTPNLKGYEGARAAKADEAAIFASASETFSQKNINCSIAESIERFRPVMAAAAADGMPVRGYVSCVVACPYEGPVAPQAVARLVRVLLDLGCYEVSLGDTIGVGQPATIRAMLDAALGEAPAPMLAGHYHDTGGNALANIETSLERGLRVFDASVGGLGGCPYAPGAKGNVDTEHVAHRLQALGFDCGLDFDRLAEAAQFARGLRTMT